MTNDKVNQLNGDSTPLKELGKLAKIVSEIKLIEGFQPIKVTASRDIFINQKPAQLLEVRTIENKGFSLIIENRNTSIEGIKHVGLDMDSKNSQFKLSFIEPNKASTENPIKNNNLNQNNNLSQNKNFEPNNSISNKINKHYSGLINQPPSQAKTSLPITNQSRTELLVRLASKVDYLSVLAEVVTESPPNSKTPNTGREAGRQAFAIEQNTVNKLSSNNQSALINTNQTQNKTPENNEARALPETNTVNKRPIHPQAASNSIPLPENEIPSKTNMGDKIQAVTPQEIKIEPKSNSQTQSNNLIAQDKEVTPLDPTKNRDTNTPIQTNKIKTTTIPAMEPRAQVNTQIENNQNTQKFDQNKPTQYRVSKETSEFIITSDIPLKIGGKIQVFTDSQGNIQLLPKQPQMRESTLHGEFAKSLPQQITKKELVQLIQNLSNIQTSEKFDVSTQKRIQQLLTSIPQRQDLDSPQAMKQAIFNSGLFLENKLFNNPSNLTRDIKANWLSIQNARPQKPTNESVAQASIKDSLDLKTGEAISQAVERITSSQIRNLLESNKLDGLNFPLVIELPIQDKNSTSIFQLQIDQDKESSSKPSKKKKWLAKLLFDFPETGKFEARLNVEDNKVALIFVAEDKDTENKIRKRSAILTRQLEDKGLEVSQLDSFSKPIEKKRNNTKKHSLIDVRS